MGADTVARPSFQPRSQNEDKSGTSTRFSALTMTALLTASGIAGRVALQHVPSVEPLIAVAAATGFYFGLQKGVVAGASGYYISNFLVYGGQGPWTIFQVLGAAAAGLAGGVAGKYFEGKYAFLSSAFIGVAVYEVLVNIGSLTFASMTGIGFTYILSALPFSLTHVASTIGFGLMLYGSRRKIGLVQKN